MSRLIWNAGQVVQDNKDIGIEGVDYFKRGKAYYTEEFVKELLNRIDTYKTRIEKAVEYIENTPLYETTYDYNMEEELEIQNVSDETASNNLLNILKGKDNAKNS